MSRPESSPLAPRVENGFESSPLAPRVDPDSRRESATLFEPERYELYEEPRYHFDLDRRDFFKLAGGGLVVCLLLDAEAPAQRFGGGNRPRELGAWLHVDEKGQVSVYTGKAEVGQNIRTSLSQVVAEELKLPVSAVQMVMADTDRVPYDMGTFGSRTTPDMAAQLRRAAAAARELLLDLAAEQAKVERGTLTVADGQVTHPPSKRSFTFGELTKGKKLTRAVGAAEKVAPPGQWKVAGTSVPKVEAEAIVTGKHRYASDVRRPGMLHGKVLRPETLNATLASVNVKAAEAMPGVTVVHDGEFVGVAAPSVHQAEQALAAIKAEWKSAPMVSGKELFDHLKKNRGAGGRGGFGGRGGGTNQGSMEKGLARTFSIPPERVRVIVPDTGSAYGGKHTVEAAVEAARLAKAAGKPVKVVWTRAEEFTWAYFRPAGVIEVTAGVTKDGLLTAWEFHNVNSGGSAIRTPYEVPNQRVAFHTSRSPLRQGSYRALAATANTFARETVMDDLAHAVKADPLEFRLKNLKDRRLRAVLEAAAKQFGWGRAKPAARHGFGIACGTEKGSYVAACAEVRVDGPTGQVQVVRLATAFECGAVLNPDHLKNQVEGAAMMGLGGALFEEVQFDKGKILNAAFARYRVPRFGDVTELETVLLDRKDLPSAGAGETPIIAVAPAVGNAIFQAAGVRLRSLPMAPHGVKA